MLFFRRGAFKNIFFLAIVNECVRNQESSLRTNRVSFRQEILPICEYNGKGSHNLTACKPQAFPEEQRNE